MSHNQVGFILGLQDWFNTQKFRQQNSLYQQSKEKSMFSSIDREKRIAKIQHPSIHYKNSTN